MTFFILTLLAASVITKAERVHWFIPLHKRGGARGLQFLRGLVTTAFLVWGGAFAPSPPICLNEIDLSGIVLYNKRQAQNLLQLN